MKIVLHIERLVLEGLVLAPADRPRLAAAVEAEFARLLRDAPVPATSAATPHLAAPPVVLAPSMTAEPMGRAIAASAHAGLIPDGARADWYARGVGGAAARKIESRYRSAQTPTGIRPRS